MTGHPFFSIVIPVYNRSAILVATLSTILKQAFKNFEIVIVDDGSTEDLSSVLKDIITKNANTRLIRQENKERGAARNNGFRNSSGEYVIFFDSDDQMHENHLQVLYDNIIKENKPAFIATKFDFVDEQGKRHSSDMSRLKQGYYDYRLFLNGNPLACNVCVRKNNDSLALFEEDRKYSIKEDWLFMLENLQKNKLFIVDQVTVSMFDHSMRSMRSNNDVIIARTKLACNWILERIKLTGEEKNKLLAHVSYFCGIHAYLEGRKKDSMAYSRDAIIHGGPRLKYISLFFKSIVGRKLISKLK